MQLEGLDLGHMIHMATKPCNYQAGEDFALIPLTDPLCPLLMPLVEWCEVMKGIMYSLFMQMRKTIENGNSERNNDVCISQCT